MGSPASPARQQRRSAIIPLASMTSETRIEDLRRIPNVEPGIVSTPSRWSCDWAAGLGRSSGAACRRAADLWRKKVGRSHESIWHAADDDPGADGTGSRRGSTPPPFDRLSRNGQSVRSTRKSLPESSEDCRDEQPAAYREGTESGSSAGTRSTTSNIAARTPGGVLPSIRAADRLRKTTDSPLEENDDGPLHLAAQLPGDDRRHGCRRGGYAVRRSNRREATRPTTPSR